MYRKALTSDSLSTHGFFWAKTSHPLLYLSYTSLDLLVEDLTQWGRSPEHFTFGHSPQSPGPTRTPDSGFSLFTVFPISLLKDLSKMRLVSDYTFTLPRLQALCSGRATPRR